MFVKMRFLIIFLSGVLCLFPKIVLSNDFSKCDSVVTMLYNYFYDPELFNANKELNNSSDTLPNITEYYPIFFRGRDPYLSAILNYEGDSTDLELLNVNIEDAVAEGLLVRFPLSILPQIDSLSTVQHIKGDPNFRSFVIDPSKPFTLKGDDSCGQLDIEEFIRMNRHSYSIDTSGTVPTINVLIVTNGDFSQLDSLGISTKSRIDNLVNTWVPIELLRKVRSLETVRKLIIPNVARPN